MIGRSTVRDLRTKIWRDRYLLLLLLPVVAHYVIFSYIPMYGIVVAFKDYKIDKGEPL